jgi:UDP-2,4-diacetamido-2,4,6-trideoxy-beta-L-altropyranose hydrolase
MAELMAAADLMLGAGGSTHWERCALGLPAIVLSLAENQRPATAAVAARGACVDLGIAANVTIAALAHTVAGLLADRPRLSAMGAAAAMLVPREGGARAVCDAVDALFVAGP